MHRLVSVFFGINYLLASNLALTNATPIEVFLLPHTHLDVGWLETWESYYYLNVSRMMPGIIDCLSTDSKKRFAWAEIAFFQKWYEEDATSSQKKSLKTLISKGQFEFVDGGFVQHDQASPTHQDIINHMTVGHRWLLENFGPSVRPHIGWSLDPFGSSSSNAALYGLMGYDALVINRIPDSVMSILKKQKSLQFVWRGSASLPESDSQIFTHVLDSYFCAPGGFRWSWSQKDSPFINDTNAASRALAFAKEVSPRAAWFQTPQIFIPWGCDFMYQNATVVFENTDRLIKEINAHPNHYNMTLKYATPLEFFTTIHNQNVSHWPVRDNTDFFPLVYKKKDHKKDVTDSWSGFFSSRPSLKKQSRKAAAAIRSAEINFVISPNSSDLDISLLQNARQAQAISLHHDAITGTMCVASEGCAGGGQAAGDHDVLNDYLAGQENAILYSDSITANVLKNLMNSHDTFQLYPVTSKKFGRFLERRQSVALVIHNPLATNRTDALSINVPLSGISVSTDAGVTVPSQTLTRVSNGAGFPYRYDQLLTFTAHVPPFGFATYFLKACEPASSWPFNCKETQDYPKLENTNTNVPIKNYQLTNNFLILYANNITGLLSIYDKSSKINFTISQQLRQYSSGERDTAYVFSPHGASVPLSHDPPLLDVQMQNGPVMQQLYMRISDQHSVIARIFNTGDPIVDGVIELQYDLGLLDMNTNVVTQINSNINNNGIWTDSNAYELVHRTYKKDVSIAENAWPQQASVVLIDKDVKKSMAILTEQSHAAILESNTPGQVQLMLGRRIRPSYQSSIVLDDQFSHSQKIWLVLGEHSSVIRTRHSSLLRTAFPLRSFGTVAAPSPSIWIKDHITTRTLASVLPTNVHIFSLTPVRANISTNNIWDVVLRLANVYEASEDSVLSSTQFVCLDTILVPAGLTIISATELTLTSMANKGDVHRWKWPTNTYPAKKLERVDSQINNDCAYNISLSPLQIRTFQITLDHR